MTQVTVAAYSTGGPACLHCRFLSLPCWTRGAPMPLYLTEDELQLLAALPQTLGLRA